MKKLSHKDITVNQLERLSSSCGLRQLFRLADDQYVIAFLEVGTKTFAFESKIFSQLLNDLGGGIMDVTFIQAEEPERIEDSRLPGYEIRLHLHGGEIAVINSEDTVYLMLPTSYNKFDETPVLPVAEVWQELPDVYPYSHLQISEDLADVAAHMMRGDSPADILNQLWSDYQSLTRDRCIKPRISCSTRVQSDHFSFCVTEHTCGRVTLSL